jgi:hypothetical protein
LPKTATSRSSRVSFTGLDEAVKEALAALRDLPAWVLAGTEMEAIVAREERRLHELRLPKPILADRSARRLTAPNAHPEAKRGSTRTAVRRHAVSKAIPDPALGPDLSPAQ